MRHELAILAFAACAGTPTDEPVPCVPLATSFAFFPPTGFPPAEAAEVDAARDTWNAVTSPSHRLAWDVESHRRILWARPPDDGLAGQFPPGWDVVFILPGTGRTRAFALHEFGHVLGLDHVSDPAAVMCSVDTGATCAEPQPAHLTAGDVAQCRDVGACP